MPAALDLRLGGDDDRAGGAPERDHSARMLASSNWNRRSDRKIAKLSEMMPMTF
jgi:hypothetical protein